MAMALDTMAMLPGHTMVDTTEDTGVDTGARRRGLPSQQPQLNPMPRLMPNPGTVPMAMVWAIIMVDMVDTADTMAMVLDTMAIADLTMADTTEDTTGVDFPSLGY